jgi:hypothetical protein
MHMTAETNAELTGYQGMDEQLLEAARAIRPYLPELVGAEASAYDQEIARLIADAQAGRNVDEQLFTVLSRPADVRDWVASVLESDRNLPPRIQQVIERGYHSLPGPGEPVDAERYECAYGDYVWYQLSVGDLVPQCPTHKRGLVSS